MPFEISPEEWREMALLEEAAGCDVEAGLDWGAAAGEYLKQSGGETALSVEQREPEKEKGKSEV